MRLSRSIGCLGVLGLLSLAPDLNAQLLIEETFTGYPDNALISASPAGLAIGLAGDWTLTPNSDFYVNKSQSDDRAGSCKAVYDRPADDNGTREAVRDTSADHVLLSSDGDVFYASFFVDAPRTNGRMTFELRLRRLDGGGVPSFSFGLLDGVYIVGSGGIEIDARGGAVHAGGQRIVARVEYGDGSSGPDDLELITLWVDPVNEQSAPVIDAASIDFLNQGGAKIVAVSIRGEQMAGHPAVFDDLRVGFSFSDVVPQAADLDGDFDVDLDDYLAFAGCLSGPEITTPPVDCLPDAFSRANIDSDCDVDLNDFRAFQMLFTTK